MTNQSLDGKLRAAIDRLPHEIPPQRDLWPGIAARITPRRPRLRSWPIAAAVAGFLAIGALIAALSLHHTSAPTGFANAPAVTPSQPSATPAMPNGRATAIAATVRRSTRLDPRMQAELLKNLGIIETSIANIQQALTQDPMSPGLQPLLYQQYRQEAALITAAQRIQLQTTAGIISS
jgi:hypothetical protein